VYARIHDACRAPDLAEDMTQHAFERLQEQISLKQIHFDTFSQFCRWLTVTARNRMVDIKRRPSEIALGDGAEPIGDHDLDPRWRAAFDSAYQRLPVDDRILLERKYRSDGHCTDEELGQMLESTEGTSSAKAQKARRRRLDAERRLRTELLKEGMDPNSFDFQGPGSLIRRRYRSAMSLARSPAEEGDMR
jgi:DNA-directed RNA polymerase specialized sigma24 family protein